MDDLLLAILVLVTLAFWIGYRMGRRRTLDLMMHNILKDPERMRNALDLFVAANQEEDTPVTRTQVAVRVEWHNNLCYLYRADTEEFISQGSSVTQAIESAPKLDPKIEYTIPADMAKQPQTTKP